MTHNRIRWVALFSSVLIATAGAAIIAARSSFSYDLLAEEGGSRTREHSSLMDEWLARLGEVVLPLLDPGDTEYQSGFSEEEFQRIEAGSKVEDVIKRLGEPLLRKSFPDGTTIWYYSRHGPQSKSFFVRALEFDDHGHVTRKFRQYYVD